MTTIEERCGNGNRKGIENGPKNYFLKKLTYYFLLYRKCALNSLLPFTTKSYVKESGVFSIITRFEIIIQSHFQNVQKMDFWTSDILL